MTVDAIIQVRCDTHDGPPVDYRNLPFPQVRERLLKAGWELADKPGEPDRCPACAAVAAPARRRRSPKKDPAKLEPPPERTDEDVEALRPLLVNALDWLTAPGLLDPPGACVWTGRLTKPDAAGLLNLAIDVDQAQPTITLTRGTVAGDVEPSQATAFRQLLQDVAAEVTGYAYQPPGKGARGEVVATIALPPLHPELRAAIARQKVGCPDHPPKPGRLPYCICKSWVDRSLKTRPPGWEPQPMTLAPA